MQKQSYTYTMPQAFMEDVEVVLHWKLYAIINGFWLNGSTVYASNQWFAERLGCSDRHVRGCLEKLQIMGLLTRKIEGKSRVILPAGKVEEGGTAGSAMAEGGVPPKAELRVPHNSISNSIRERALPSKARPLEDSEDVSIAATDEEGNELVSRKKGSGRNVVAERVASYFNTKAREYSGKPVIGYAYSILKGIIVDKKMKEEFLKQVVDEFFDSMPPDDKAVNPYVCFSSKNINRTLLS